MLLTPRSTNNKDIKLYFTPFLDLERDILSSHKTNDIDLRVLPSFLLSNTKIKLATA